MVQYVQWYFLGDSITYTMMGAWAYLLPCYGQFVV